MLPGLEETTHDEAIDTEYGAAGAGAGVFLDGCQGGQSGAASAIQKYLQARAASDVDQMTLLSCPAWEAQARVEAASFKSMNAKLDGVTCQVSGSDGGTTLVTCQGHIVTTYQGEARNGLSATTRSKWFSKTASGRCADTPTD